jgi:hypothetical protein
MLAPDRAIWSMYKKIIYPSKLYNSIGMEKFQYEEKING